MVKNLIFGLALCLVTTAAPSALAQTEPGATAQTAPRAAVTQVPLKVQLVVSRYAGEKKVSNIPYTLSVVANDNDKTSLRMGVDVPVPTTVFKGGGPTTTIPQTSFNYRSVGTNIDCTARSADGGLFKLNLAVADTSIFVPDKPGSAAPNPVEGVPAFRSFTSTFNVLLKDGETAQHISATDPVSGDVLRIDVTLTVMK